TVGREVRWSHLKATYEWFDQCPPDVRAGFVTAMGDMDVRGAFAEVELPVTVLIGSRDVLCPPWLGRAMARQIPGAEVITVPGRGHMLPIEDPALVADAIASAAG
ncbi:MAG: alpha/beta fold hydrolase, partial [Acidimicrobiales bacterium]